MDTVVSQKLLFCLCCVYSHLLEDKGSVPSLVDRRPRGHCHKAQIDELMLAQVDLK